MPIRYHSAPAPSRHGRPGKRINESRRCFHYNSGNEHQSPGGENHAQAALPAAPNWNRPSAHPTPSTSRSLYRIAGQDYCRHHIIKAAVAAASLRKCRLVAALTPCLSTRGSDVAACYVGAAFALQ